jgi:hypothetical protein
VPDVGVTVPDALTGEMVAAGLEADPEGRGQE